MSGEYSILTEALAQIESHEFRVGTAAQHGTSSLGWEVAYSIVHDLRDKVLERERRPIQSESDDFRVGIAVSKSEATMVSDALWRAARQDRSDLTIPISLLAEMDALAERFAKVGES